MSVQSPGDNTLAFYGNTLLRAAIRGNIVTFPAQIPVFMKPPKGCIQQRAVQLYFVRGWSVRGICNRFNLAKRIVQNLVSDWRIRAISGGLIQQIEPEELYRLVLEQASNEKDRHLPDYQSPLNSHPFLRDERRHHNRAASELMMALRDYCMELSLELSRDRMCKIERIVRDSMRPDANLSCDLAETNGLDCHYGMRGLQPQPELMLEWGS